MGADADIFLILLRPTRVPVVGESLSHLFQGQVLIETMQWNLHNEEERKSAAKVSSAFESKKDEIESDLKQRRAIDDFKKEEQSLQKAHQRAVKAGEDPTEAFKAYVGANAAATKELYRRFDKNKIDKKADPTDEERRDEAYAEADRNRNFEITFTKRIDLSSTQMLNSMKAGDIFPSGTLTIHKRSATAADGTSLVFTIQKIRLLSYKLKVAVTDTMTEMMEEWTCEFGALAYVYKNPPAHYSHDNAVQGGVKSASQGTMRAFTMKNIGSPI